MMSFMGFNIHAITFCAGFVLDLLLGDPPFFWHPVRLIGGLIQSMEQLWNSRSDTADNRFKGLLTVANTLLVTGAVASEMLRLGYFLHPVVGAVLETVMIWLLFATKSLRSESDKVRTALEAGELELARKEVSMIVGRDTESLDEAGICRAAVETVAENTSDGVIAPMLYTALFGPVGGYLYKAVNTLDSMIGYKNKRFRSFGMAAARLDDLVNFIPSRLSAALLLLASVFFGQEYDTKRGLLVWWRDRNKSTSPNAGQTESVVAGLLGVRLLGDAVYFGRAVPKETIGDDTRPIEAEDIRRAGRLLYAAAGLTLILGILFIAIVGQRLSA